MAYPSTFSSFNRPASSDRLNSPSHSALHNTVSSAVGQVEAVIGLTGSGSVLGTLIGDLRSPSSDGGGHVQTANKGGTGQTSFNKGDLLVGQSSSVLVKLGVGVDNQVIVADSSVASGIKWGAAPVTNVQSFLSSGIWTKPAAAGLLSPVYVRVWAAGGSGARGTTTSEMGGGGGGFYNEGWFVASMLSSSVFADVGLGGASVTGAGTNGLPGGVSVFDSVSSLISAFGGGGGGNSATGGGGGGAGNIFGVGQQGQDNLGGAAGAGYGYPFVSTGGDANTNASVATHAGGGGGDSDNGGSTIYGGAGGGGARASIAGSGGTSKIGGNGGAAGYLVDGTAGSRPGGGGGASYGGTYSGAGGDGKIIVTTFL